MGRFAAFVTFVLLVAGCTSGSGDPDDTFTPTSTYTPPSYSISSSPPTPSIATTGPNVRPGEQPPKLPVVGTTHTRPGATTFASYFVAALDWGYATMDSTLAKSLFTKACTWCTRLVRDRFDQEATAGHHYVGARVGVASTQIVTNDHRHPGTTVVDLKVIQVKGALVNASGATVQRLQRGHGTFRTWLSWRGDHWVVIDWKEVVFK